MPDDRDEKPTMPLPVILPPPPQIHEDGGYAPAPAPARQDLLLDEADPAPAPSSEPPAPIVLVDVNGRTDGRGTLVTSDIATIGRSGDTLTLALTHDAWASKEHARLRYHDAAWWLEDLGSKNGTWLDGSAVTTPTSIHPGQIIRVGHSEILVSDDLTLATPHLATD